MFAPNPSCVSLDYLYELPVPPIYAAGPPTSTAPGVFKDPYEVDQYAEIEKDTRSKEEESITTQLYELYGLRRALKSLQVTRGTMNLDYDDLCIHPDDHIPVGYKPPKFDDGKGDLHAHLRAYCDKLVV